MVLKMVVTIDAFWEPLNPLLLGILELLDLRKSMFGEYMEGSLPGLALLVRSKNHNDETFWVEPDERRRRQQGKHLNTKLI